MTEPAKRSDGAASMAAEEFAAWNERMVARYDIERYYERSHGLVRWIENRRIAELVKLAAPRAGERVLEVGCGAGHVLQRFEGTERTGMDLSQTMLERARRRLPKGVRLMQGSADSLPFASSSFDIVLCTEVLEHVQDPRRVIAELVRVAGPRGRVVVSIPNELMIDRVKRVLRRTPVVRKALSTLAAEGNEWHLHTMDADMLRRITDGVTNIRSLRAVPNRMLPIRWVVLLGAP